jgi:hypothetical protein
MQRLHLVKLPSRLVNRKRGIEVLMFLHSDWLTPCSPGVPIGRRMIKWFGYVASCKLARAYYASYERADKRPMLGSLEVL